ncbi:MAG: dienelactone hydrolase family protein [Bryobacterales bacterium]|nr:dienelactone hydrolase family protein [Bryobacterales bacterium]
MPPPTLLLIAVQLALAAYAQPGAAPAARINHHRVTNTASPAPEPGAENQPLPSLVEGLRSPSDWQNRRRPEILAFWTRLLGKLEPARGDRKWFGDIRKARILDTQEFEHYTRIRLDLPIEKDFYQSHLLLLPKNQGPGPFPAVIAWTSTTPDFTQPELWWGQWLARHGYVVLTSWSFIRHYRDDSSYRKNTAGDKLRARFGHWLPMAKMVHDARRQAEYLRSLKQVDRRRLGFIGFSLSAKAALYIAAFAPEFHATVSLDPHIAINGGTNWFAPWYLDWLRPYPAIPTPEHTILSMLNPDAARPGFEHDHHELLALAAPRPFLLIGGRGDCEDCGGDSDDLQSWGYVNRAREVYALLGVPDRLQFVLTRDGHHANGPEIDPAWQAFFERWLKSPTAPR